MQEPAHRLAAAHQALAIKPHAHALAALDAEIVAGQRAIVGIAPPLHRDALGAFHMRDLMQHMTPPKPHRRSVGNFGNSIHRLGAGEQANGAGGGEGVLLELHSSPRKRGPSSWPWLPAYAGMSGS